MKMKDLESEAAIQTTFFEWIDLNAPKYPVLSLCFAIPNEGNRSAFNGWKRKLTGRRAGVPDICLPVPNDEFHGLWIEMKSKRGTVSPSQRIWHKQLTDAGHRVEIARDWITAANLVIEHLRLPVQRL